MGDLRGRNFVDRKFHKQNSRNKRYVISNWGRRIYVCSVDPKATAKMYDKKLQSLDHAWTLDSQMISAVCSEKEGTLKAHFWQQCLPSKESALESGVAHERALGLLQSPLFQWAAPSSQGEVKTAASLVANVEQGQPLCAASLKSPWLQKVHAQLSYFIRCEVEQELEEVGDKEEKQGIKIVKVTLYGREALQTLWQGMAKSGKKAGIADYKIFSVFRHLLAPEVQKELDAAISKLYTGAAEQQQQQQQKKSRASKSKVKRSAEQDADAFALSLVGGL